MKALLAIDIQQGITNRKLYQKELFLETVNRAIDTYRKNGDAIIFVQHENNQLIKGEGDWKLDKCLHANNTDNYFSKAKADAFSEKGLREFLDANGIRDVLVCGLVSHGCVSYTAKSGMSLGYNISLLKGGHTNWHKDASGKISSTEQKLTELGVKITDAQNAVISAKAQDL